MHSSKKSHNHRFVQGISFGIVFDELFGGMPLVIDSKPKMEYSYDNVVVRARELDREIARTDETRDKIVTYTLSRRTRKPRAPSNFILMCTGRDIRSLYHTAAS